MCDCKEKLSALEVENAELKTRLARLEARAQAEAVTVDLEQEFPAESLDDMEC